CSRSARASARLACSRSALLGFGGGPGGGGRRRPLPGRRVKGRHFGPPNRQFHDKLSRLYGSLGSSIGTSRVSALLSSEYAAMAPGSAPAPDRFAARMILNSHADAGQLVTDLVGGREVAGGAGGVPLGNQRADLVVAHCRVASFQVEI